MNVRPTSPLAQAFGLGLLLASACTETRQPTVEVPTWTAVEELRLGSLNDTAFSLTRVGGFTVGDDGTIYVGQPQDGVVRVFSPTGQPLGELGGPGEGPGEFGRVSSLGLLGDTLYVTDNATQRITLFSRDGVLLGTRPAPQVQLGPNLISMPPFMILPGGRAIMSPAVASATPEATVPSFPQVLIDDQGRVVDTLGHRSREHMSAVFERAGSYMSTFQPFADGNILTFNPSPLLTADVVRRAGGETQFRITVTRDVHDTVYSRVYDYAPVAIPPALVDSVKEAMTGRVERLYGSRRAAQDAVDEVLYVPASLPPVSRARFSVDGGLWLQREEVPGGVREWLALDADGDAIGTFQLPPHVEVLFVRDRRLWGVETGEFDVPYVVRYRLDPGDTGR